VIVVERPIAQLGEGVQLQRAQDAPGGAFIPSGLLVRHPIERHGAQRVRGFVPGLHLRGLAQGAGVFAIFERLPGLGGKVAGLAQGRFGVYPKGKALFLAGEAVFQAPISPAGGGDFDIQPGAIKMLSGLGEGAQLGIGKGHFEQGTETNVGAFLGAFSERSRKKQGFSMT